MSFRFNCLWVMLIIQVLRRYLKKTNNDTMEAHLKGRPVDKHNL